jgi:hypothetical protein
VTKVCPAIAATGNHGSRLERCRLNDHGRVAARQRFSDAVDDVEINFVRVDLDRAREHVGTGLCRRLDPGEAKDVAARDRNPRLLRRASRKIAGNALCEAASSENQDVAWVGHVLSFGVAALTACPSDPLPGLASAMARIMPPGDP